MSPGHGGPAADLRTHDGLRLHVEVTGEDTGGDMGYPGDRPDVTVVLAHGWTQSIQTWRYQARDLPRLVDGVRVVRYDHRGHGRSDGVPECDATVDNLAHDLGVVIDSVAPEGPLVLAGHSMGGMAMMALAEHRPELFVDRVAGAVFVSTSGGQLDAVTLGLPRAMGARLRTQLPRILALRARMLSRRTRRRPPTIESQVVRRFLLGRPIRLADHRAVLDDLVATPADSMCGFFSDLMLHDRSTALAAMETVPTMVLVGEKDRLTPPVHARRLAETMPWAQLTVLPEAGHMLPLERDRAVTQALAELVRQHRRRSAEPAGQPHAQPV
ncbi:MAG: alpha/beta hydrolase [Actinomycetota bacterium]|nr:alpha/beta hydrolase [Actinomycetota bacterium]